MLFFHYLYSFCVENKTVFFHQTSNIIHLECTIW